MLLVGFFTLPGWSCVSGLTSSARSSSPIDSERSDGSFHSAPDSSAIRTTGPDPAPILAPSLFRERPFDAATHHPRIGDQQGSCPYRVTSYRDYEHYNMDDPFGLHVHHPQFLEWVGAPESAAYSDEHPVSGSGP